MEKGCIAMILTILWTIFATSAAIYAILNGTGAAVTAAAMEGASSAVRLTIAIAGPLCLWSGIGRLMERLGLTAGLSKLLSPVLHRLFPSCRTDPRLAGALSANVCANLLGLGNAATPMGIQAVRRLQDPRHPELATDEMCRLVVMNTASIQLLPTTVAALRASAGAASPFDLLPCVWMSSILSVAAGLLAAWIMGRCRHG